MISALGFGLKMFFSAECRAVLRVSSIQNIILIFMKDVLVFVYLFVAKGILVSAIKSLSAHSP